MYKPYILTIQIFIYFMKPTNVITTKMYAWTRNWASNLYIFNLNQRIWIVNPYSQWVICYHQYFQWILIKLETFKCLTFVFDIKRITLSCGFFGYLFMIMQRYIYIFSLFLLSHDFFIEKSLIFYINTNIEVTISIWKCWYLIPFLVKYSVIDLLIQ